MEYLSNCKKTVFVLLVSMGICLAASGFAAEAPLAAEGMAVQQEQMLAEGFIDISGSWAFSEIMELSGKGIINGTDAIHFSPDKEISRGEFVQWLVSAVDMPEALKKPNFSDVPGDLLCYEAVGKAYSAGVITGAESGRFEPERALLREEMAAMAVRVYALKNGIDLNTILTIQMIRFKDELAASPWARRSVVLADSFGLMKGKDGKQFAPRDTVTRAEAAIVVKRLMKAK